MDPDTHGWVIHPDDAAWGSLLAEYGGEYPDPLRQVFKVVRESGCQTVVVENRYVDRDYRADHQAFWGAKFQPPSAFARRLHFFSAHLDEEGVLALENSDEYLGYTVLRPLRFGPVGRTVVAPPPGLAGARLAVVDDEVSLWGARLRVTGVPFCQQDTEFLTCAHVTAWICHYVAWRHGLSGRRTTADLVLASPPIMSERRVYPSPGMTLKQLQAVFAELGHPALFYGLSRMPRVEGVEDPEPPEAEPGVGPEPPGLWDTRMISVICRYLNSGFPVLVAGREHALALVGWYRAEGGIRFVSCDDQAGPYATIGSPFKHGKAPWHSIMVPLPPRVLVSAEAAENRAHLALLGNGSGADAPPEWRTLAEGLQNRAFTLRTVVRSVGDYKEQLPAQGRGDQAVRALRLARLAHFVWVVEAHDKARLRRGEPSVVAEYVFDATSNDRKPDVLAATLPGLTFVFPPEGQRVTSANPVDFWTSFLSLPRTSATLPTTGVGVELESRDA